MLVASSAILMAVAIEMSPPNRKEIIAPEPSLATAIPGRMNIPERLQYF